VPVSGATVTVTVSIGLATAGTEEAEAVVRRADAALYGAKQAGRDRVMVAAA
jgi:diguanylate cyclase (GGDEF)-like protein